MRLPCRGHSDGRRQKVEPAIAPTAGLVGAIVTVTLESETQMPSGASAQVVRTVTENARSLRLTSHGFERSDAMVREAGVARPRRRDILAAWIPVVEARRFSTGS